MATRLHRHFDKDGKELEPTYVEVSNEELADEAEGKVFARVDEIINGIDSLPKAREFLKRLCKRLVSKGYLP